MEKRSKISAVVLCFGFVALFSLVQSAKPSFSNEAFRRVKNGPVKLYKMTAKKAYDSRGKETIEVTVVLSKNGKKYSGSAKVPAGASLGGFEAATVPVEQALRNVEEIGRRLKEDGISLLDQNALDNKMREYDGTDDLHNLGGNALVGISLAASRAAAAARNSELWQYVSQLAKAEPGLPLFQMNFFNGGKHSKANLEFQETMVIPDPQRKFTPDKWLKMGEEVFAKLGEVLEREKQAGRVSYFDDSAIFGDERGYAPVFAESIKNRTEYTFGLLIEAIEAAGYTPGEDFALASDVAANTLQEKAAVQVAEEFIERTKDSTKADLRRALSEEWNLTPQQSREFLNLASPKERAVYLEEFYPLRADAGYLFEGEIRTTNWMMDYYERLVDKYPIISIEDAFSEWDWGHYAGKNGWELLTQRLGDKVQLVIDDLSVTNLAFLGEAIERGAGNAILIKTNQNGTLAGKLGTLAVIAKAREAGYNIVVSHRSGETEDDYIGDLSVGVGAEFIKTGGLGPQAPMNERLGKYLRVIAIWRQGVELGIFSGP